MEIESSPAKPSIEMKLKVEVLKRGDLLVDLHVQHLLVLGLKKDGDDIVLARAGDGQKAIIGAGREMPARFQRIDRGEALNDCDRVSDTESPKSALPKRRRRLTGVVSSWLVIGHLSLVTCQIPMQWGDLINGE